MADRKRDFDSDAQRWDENPGKVKLANDIADSILEEVDFKPDMDALDFGCGTGLVTLRLQPYVRTITGVDSSRGMLDILDQKIKKLELKNVRTSLINTDEGDTLEGRYNLIVSSMTFHHVGDVKFVLDQFARVALPSAYLCVADLDLDRGLFHEDSTGVAHSGFDRAGLRHMFMDAGFEDVRHRIAAKVTKPVRENVMTDFSIFLMIGRKRS